MSKTFRLVVLTGGICILLPYLLGSQTSQHARNSQSFEEKAGSLCQQAKDKRDMYLEIWKKQFLKRNSMEQAFFDKHVSVTKYDIECQWKSGLSLRVAYNVTYDWAVVGHQDQIVVLLYDQEKIYRHLPIKRDHLFDEEEVSYAIDNAIFFTTVGRVKALDKLGFASYEDALKAFRKKIGSENLDNVRLAFFVPGRRPQPSEDGHPYLLGRGIDSMDKNVCIGGYMDLVTGEVVAQENACVVN